MAMSAETLSRRAAARKREKFLNSLQSVERIAEYYKTADGDVLAIHLDKFGKDEQVIEFHGPDAIKLANEWLPKMGMRPVRLTRNMLNPNSPTLVIDINTPAYCDPGRESYHSM